MYEDDYGLPSASQLPLLDLLCSSARIPCWGLRRIVRLCPRLLRLRTIWRLRAVCRILVWLARLVLNGRKWLLGRFWGLQIGPCYKFTGSQRVLWHRWRRGLLSQNERDYRECKTTCENRHSKDNISSKMKRSGVSRPCGGASYIKASRPAWATSIHNLQHFYPQSAA